jgi:hypothetical protein
MVKCKLINKHTEMYMWNPTLSTDSTAHLVPMSNFSCNVNKTYDKCWSIPRLFIYCSRKVRQETTSAQLLHLHRYTREAKNNSTLINQRVSTTANATCCKKRTRTQPQNSKPLEHQKSYEGTCFYNNNQRIDMLTRTLQLWQVLLESSSTSMRGRQVENGVRYGMWDYGYRVITKHYAV